VENNVIILAEKAKKIKKDNISETQKAELDGMIMEFLASYTKKVEEFGLDDKKRVRN